MEMVVRPSSWLAMDGIFQHLNGEELLKIASSRRRGWAPCHFVCSSIDLPHIIEAGNAIIVILTFTKPALLGYQAGHKNLDSM